MKLKALLLCRSAQSRRHLDEALDELGIEQECCGSAQEAIELLARGNYPALVLDFDLGGAAHVARLARLAPPQRRPVVFAMIGASSDVASTFQAGANFVLYKPLVAEQVGRSLRAGRAFMRDERRRATRHNVETVVYLRFGKTLAIPALMLDLTADGLSVQAADPLPAVEKVPVHFLLPDSTRAIEGTAEMIWADDSGRAGMLFSDLSTATERYLKNWLARRSRRKSSARISPAPRLRAATLQG